MKTVMMFVFLIPVLSGITALKIDRPPIRGNAKPMIQFQVSEAVLTFTSEDTDKPLQKIIDDLTRQEQDERARRAIRWLQAGDTSPQVVTHLEEVPATIWDLPTVF